MAPFRWLGTSVTDGRIRMNLIGTALKQRSKGKISKLTRARELHPTTLLPSKATAHHVSFVNFFNVLTMCGEIPFHEDLTSFDSTRRLDGHVFPARSFRASS